MNLELTSAMKNLSRQKGFSLPELLIVLLVGAILLTLAIPQIVSSRRLFKFSSMQSEISASLRNARQEAMGQRKPITFRYQNNRRETIIYGGKFGSYGSAGNIVVKLAGSGVESNDIRYGRPSGVSGAALGDGTSQTALTGGAVEITFQSDGSVINASNNPTNNALYFYHNKHAKDTAFAISVLGAGGRVKVWRYNKSLNQYVE